MRIGVDVGGTKIEVVALSDHGEILYRQRAATPDNYPAALTAMVTLVGAAEQATGRQGQVGVGIPGSYCQQSGTVNNATVHWLNGKSVVMDLSEQLRRTIRIDNDANCLAVSEAVDGAGAGASVLFAVVVGTGCGAGLAINGQSISGYHGIAGEWGHNPLPWQNAEDIAFQQQVACYCGKPGCIETFISGTGFAKDYQLHTGEYCSGEQIMQRVAKGEKEAGESLERYQQRLAKSLATVINLLDPQVIVLGGGMSNIPQLYQALPLQLAEWVVGGECRTPIRPAKHGDSSGVRGAAWLWPKG